MEKVSITQFLNEQIPDLIAIYQFGSQARGTVRPTSDMDIAVLALTRTPAERLLHLAQELAIQLGRNVDLMDLRSMTTVMRAQIISTGRCLKSHDDQARAEFEMYAYSGYARFNEERRALLEDIKERGLIYG